MFIFETYLITKVDLRGQILTMKAYPEQVGANLIHNLLELVDWEPGVDQGVRIEHLSHDGMRQIYRTGSVFHASDK